jgi:regulatory LuxR family protein
LTNRQLEVVRLIAVGKSNKEIAAARGIDREPELEPAAVVVFRALDREPELEPAAVVVFRALSSLLPVRRTLLV